MDARGIFEDIAQEVGLDKEVLSECVINEETKRMVLAEKEKGNARWIRQTPTYYVNGKMVVGVKQLKLKLNKLLSEYEI